MSIRPQWEGSPGKMQLISFRGVKLSLARWNNLDTGSPRIKKLGPFTFWKNPYPNSVGRGQFFIKLRPYKAGRRNLYLKFIWGYRR